MMKFWTVLAAFVLFAFCAGAEVSFVAQVPARAEAENAAAAKEAAMAEANRKAFLEVAGRLTTPENVLVLNKLTDEQLLHFIQEVSVVDEKSGGKAYHADLNIKINGGLLKQYMQENGMLEIVSVPMRVLIVPVYSDMEFSGRALWEDGNVWRSAWLEKGLIKSGALDFKVVADTAANRDLLTPYAALNMDKKTYALLSAGNGTNNIFTAHAVRAGRNNMVVIVTSYPDLVEKRFTITDENGETVDKAIAQTVAYITDVMQNKNLVENSAQGKLTAYFYYFRLKEWLDAEKKLKSIPQIKKVETNAAGGGQVELVLEYAGSQSALLAALENAGMGLQSENGKYILK